jgi:hypothetical protein
MKVETYELDEVNTEHPECTDESLKLMEQMGLKGQLELVKQPEPDATAKSFPHRKMTKDEHTVYSILCPGRTALDRYSDTQVPLRVLQVAALAKDHFKNLIVLHPQTVAKDPVLIGCESEWNSSTWFILARWGEELDAWPLLIEKATKKYSEQLISDLDEGMHKLTGLKDAIKSGVSGAFMLKHSGTDVSVRGPGL